MNRGAAGAVAKARHIPLPTKQGLGVELNKEALPHYPGKPWKLAFQSITGSCKKSLPGLGHGCRQQRSAGPILPEIRVSTPAFSLYPNGGARREKSGVSCRYICGDRL